MVLRTTRSNRFLGSASRRQPWDRKFRLMKDETGAAGHGGGAPAVTTTPAGGANNGGGNGAPASGDSQTPNNRGQQFDPSTFWTRSVEGESGTAPSGESTPTPTPSTGQPPVNPTVAAIQALNFGQGLMDPDTVSELAEGKTAKFEEKMTGFGRQAVEQSLRIVLPIMQQLREQMREEFKTQMGGEFQTRENNADLLSAIPSAKDPAVRPQVQSIFDRAMSLTKGDRKAAIDMTKSMLQMTATTLGTDIGLPPKSAGDGNALIPSNVNWLDELAGRK